MNRQFTARWPIRCASACSSCCRYGRGRPRSAGELAGQVGPRPERLYHHLAQLEAAKLIEISGYRPLTGWV